MNQSFWKSLPKPFSVLAPMADVTDPPFRSIIAKYGRPDVMYTQFVSCDGLCSEGFDALVPDLAFAENERPIVAQFFGNNPDTFYESAKLASEFGFDGIDINMGCPDKNVMKQKAGAALIKDPKRAVEIILATQEGAGVLPVSIKTRIGDTANELPTWLPVLLKASPEAIIIHARTRKQMSKVPANWDYIKEAVSIAAGSDTLIVGNGDVQSIDEGNRLAIQTGCDGIMYGRAIFGNPWLGNNKTNQHNVSTQNKLQTLIEHTNAYEAFYGSGYKFPVMKKHFKAYVEGFDGAKELRTQLMKCHNASEVEKVLIKFLRTI